MYHAKVWLSQLSQDMKKFSASYVKHNFGGQSLKKSHLLFSNNEWLFG
jgi:hypothetical protein